MEDGAALKAFFDSDRRWRSPDPTSRDVWSRACALQALGFPRAAAADLMRVERCGLRDLYVLRWFVEHHPDPAKRRASARAALADHRIGDVLRRISIETLLDGGDPVVGYASRRNTAVAGWLAWRGSGMPTLDAAADVSCASRPAIDLTEVDGTGAAFRLAEFAFTADPGRALAIRPSLGGSACPSLTVHPGKAAPSVPPEPWTATAALTVILPVFGDPSSLAVCLAALRAQRTADIAYVLIDDASPDPAVAKMAEDFAREVGGSYIRKSVNGGFAVAVNTGLALCTAGDALILNSDVILPPGALWRLRSAASREPDIGTLSPMSNDAGCASFPIPLLGGPALPAAEALAVDAVAAEVNAGQVFDVPVPLGSCFYVTRRCVDRVGSLSLRYGRGYYEDVEFHLRAGEAGLRSVVACDVYVSHLGGRSFGADRQALVGRNHAILHRRFPNYRAADALFDRVDLMRPIRGAIEGRLAPPSGPAILIVARSNGGDTSLRDRERFWRERGRWVLILRWKTRAHGVAVGCAVSNGDGPRSLDFMFGEAGSSGLLSYLARVGRGRIELLEPGRIPACLLDLLQETGRPLHAIVDSLASAGGARGASPTAVEERPRVSGADERGRRWTVVARDRMAAACLGLDPPDLSMTSTSSPEVRGGQPGVATLGVLLPEACPRAERLTLALALSLRRLRRTTRVVVLGQSCVPQSLTAPGNVWVSGPLGGDDPAEVAAHYAVDRIVSPYRTSLFWHVDDVARRLERPKAYFDWSGGRLSGEDGDLALPPTVDDDAAAASLAEWCDVAVVPSHRPHP